VNILSIVLALHTTTENLEIAIAYLDGDTLTHELTHVRQQSWHLGRELATQIHTCLTEFCHSYDMGFKWSDVAFIAIAKGVGGYTSTRIGIVLARTLGEQLDVPVYAIDCDVIQQNALQNDWQTSSQTQTQQSLGLSLLSIAYHQWQQKIYPNWSEALPVYSSDYS